MLPALKDNALVISLPISFKEGDVVIANANKRDVIKRVESIDKDTVLLAGDNKKQSASYTVAMCDILGKVVWPLKV